MCEGLGECKGCKKLWVWAKGVCVMVGASKGCGSVGGCV